jgi:carboxylesterase
VPRAFAEIVKTWREHEARLGVPPPDRTFALPGDDAKQPVLLLHGGGGVPSDLRELGEFLSTRGYPCLCPLLPDHGLGAKRLSRVRFSTLLARSLEAFDLLVEEARGPSIVAQSLGAVLAIRLAACRDVPKLVTLAPALRPRVASRAFWLVLLAPVRPDIAFATYRWQTDVRRGIEETRQFLANVTCPLLIFHSREDSSVSIRGAHELAEAAASKDKSLRVLDGQGHVLSKCENRVRAIFEPTLSFLES